MDQTTNHLLALDIGDKRVGVALASFNNKLPRPLVTLNNDLTLVSELQKIIEKYRVNTVIAGLPRSLNGDDSEQTKKVRQIIDNLSQDLGLPIITQDEALSSVRAEEELKSRGKMFAKMEIDKLAATFILEDYIAGLDNE